MKNIKGNLIRASQQFVVGCSDRMHTIVCMPRTLARKNSNNSTNDDKSTVSTTTTTSTKNFERTTKAIRDLQHSYYNRVLAMAGTSTSFERNTSIHHERRQEPSPPSSPKFAPSSSAKKPQESPCSTTATFMLSTPPPPPRPKFEAKDFVTELLSPDTVRHLQIPTLDERDDVETRMNPFYLEPRASSSFCF
jgi:hypothetical protein